MNISKILSLSTVAASLLVLAGCTTQTATNTANQNTNTTNANVKVITNESGVNTNLKVVANTNETVTNENINTEQMSEVDLSAEASAKVDTSDWLTYTNDEYGFSFRYPNGWTLKVNDAGLVSLTNKTSNIRAKIFVSENVVDTSIDEKTALKFEDGREPTPLVSEEFISINGLSSYRAFRQLKKGEPIFTAEELNEITRTEIEYTYLSEDDLCRIWFTIDGENTEFFYETVDAIGQSFSI